MMKSQKMSKESKKKKLISGRDVHLDLGRWCAELLS